MIYYMKLNSPKIAFGKLPETTTIFPHMQGSGNTMRVWRTGVEMLTNSVLQEHSV